MTIFITGATDGIGLVTAKMLAEKGHSLILHGRNIEKLQNLTQNLQSLYPQVHIESAVADLAHLEQVKNMADALVAKAVKIDVLINNAGVFMTNSGLSLYGIDTRFVVNTIAPYLLTRLLMPIFTHGVRILNLSSRAQMSIDWHAFQQGGELEASSAYAQSKLGITLWSFALARELGTKAMVLAINPKSFLGSKMVQEAYGQKGYDVSIGAELLCRAALSEEFSAASGRYYDNDIESFAQPHPDTLSTAQQDTLLQSMNTFLRQNHLL